ncbi:MAG: NAD-dependent epimerase/dehydratase family protein [Nitrososphaerales archaeon]
MQAKIIEEDIKTIVNDIGPLVQRLNGKTIVVTGGAGFLGRYFLLTFDYISRNLLSQPMNLVVVDNFLTGRNDSFFKDIDARLINQDIRVPFNIEGEVDYVVHLAGVASPIFYNKFKIETIEVSTIGTKNMLDLARQKQVESFLNFSSSEIYGDPDPKFIPTPETYNGNVSCIGPRACYDESKRLGETLCMTYFQVYGIPIKIVRPFNIYGPGMKADDFRVIPNLVAHALKGNPLPTYGSGTQTRTFCYPTDALTAFMKVLLSNHNGEVFNVGNDSGEISIRDLATMVSDLFQNRVELKFLPGPIDAYLRADPKRRCPDLTKIKSMLKYEPKVELKQGLERFIQWIRETNDWY